MSNVQMRWIDHFEVGIAELDADHREMHRQVNIVCHAALSGDHVATGRHLAALAELAAAHFKREALLKTAFGGSTSMPFENGTVQRDEVLANFGARLHEEGVAFDLSSLPSALIDWFCKQTIGHDAWIRACFHETGPKLLPR